MVSRRSVLAGCCAVVGTAVAGCSALSSWADEDGSSPPAYADWIPTVDGPLSFDVVDVAAIRGIDGRRHRLEANHLVPGSEVDRDLRIDGDWVTTGTFTQETVVELLEADPDHSATPYDEYGGYDLYPAPEYSMDDDGEGPHVEDHDDPKVFGLRDGIWIDATYRSSLEAFVGAEAGDTERLVDESESFRRLLAELDGTIVEGEVRLGAEAVEDFEREDVVARGRSEELRSDEADHRVVHVFADENAVDEFLLRESPLVDDAADRSSLEPSVDGRVVTAEYRTSAAE